MLATLNTFLVNRKSPKLLDRFSWEKCFFNQVRLQEISNSQWIEIIIGTMNLMQIKDNSAGQLNYLSAVLRRVLIYRSSGALEKRERSLRQSP